MRAAQRAHNNRGPDGSQNGGSSMAVAYAVASEDVDSFLELIRHIDSSPLRYMHIMIRTILSVGGAISTKTPTAVFLVNTTPTKRNVKTFTLVR